MSAIGSVFIHLRPNVTENTVLDTGDAITSAIIQGSLFASDDVTLSSTVTDAATLEASALTFKLSGEAGHVAISGISFLDSVNGSGVLSAQCGPAVGFTLSANQGCCIMAVIATSAVWDTADTDNDQQFFVGTNQNTNVNRIHFARSTENAATGGNIGFEDATAGLVK